MQQYGLPTDGGGCTLMAKVDINGPATAPLWAHAKLVNRVESIGWNFDGIFIFDAHGQPQGRYHRGDLTGADATLRRLLGWSGRRAARSACRHLPLRRRPCEEGGGRKRWSWRWRWPWS